MKFKNIILSSLISTILIGCGGGGGGGSSSTPSSSSTNDNNLTATPLSYDVTAERGAILGGTVVDSNGQIATSNPSSNVYTFANAPVYPITVSGGVIDVDRNGIDEGDISLLTPLKSYSNVITPITDFIGDSSSIDGKNRLEKLKTIFGTNEDELLNKVPSEVNTNILVLTNTIYNLKNQDGSLDDDFLVNYENSDFKRKFEELKIVVAGVESINDVSKILEEKVIDDLKIEKFDISTAQEKLDEITNPSFKLKFSDLTRFISYEIDGLYDENLIINNKLEFKSYKFVINDLKKQWLLNSENYIDLLDSSNPYELNYKNPQTQEEGIISILSTKKVETFGGNFYDDLYQTKLQGLVTKKASQLKWNRLDTKNPSYFTDNQEIFITNIDEYIKSKIMEKIFDLNGKFYSEDGLLIGTWSKNSDILVCKNGKKSNYFRIVKENGDYFIEQADINDIGYVSTEFVYTGLDLDKLIKNITTSAPVFDGDTKTIFVKENQTKDIVLNVDDTLPLSFTISGEDATMFSINQDTKTLSFLNIPDNETKKEYSIFVTATNSAGKSSSQYLNINF